MLEGLDVSARCCLRVPGLTTIGSKEWSQRLGRQGLGKLCRIRPHGSASEAHLGAGRQTGVTLAPLNHHAGNAKLGSSARVEAPQFRSLQLSLIFCIAVCSSWGDRAPWQARHHHLLDRKLVLVYRWNERFCR